MLIKQLINLYCNKKRKQVTKIIYMAHFAYDPYFAGKKVTQEQKIGEDHFHAWTKDNHFRTSYGTMYTQVIFTL